MKEKSSKNEKLQPFPTHQTAQGKAPSRPHHLDHSHGGQGTENHPSEVLR